MLAHIGLEYAQVLCRNCLPLGFSWQLIRRPGSQSEGLLIPPLVWSFSKIYREAHACLLSLFQIKPDLAEQVTGMT